MPYPVLYLQHGGGEDERVWTEMGRTNVILDNLLKRLYFRVRTDRGWVYVEKEAAGWSAARSDDPSFNTPDVAPDESFLLFTSNRPLKGDKEDMYIHVSFRTRDGA